MAESREYQLRIDAYTPDSIPMSRLAEYLADLAQLMGYSKSVHFVRLEQGSTNIVHKVDAEDVPKVENRLRAVAQHDAPDDVMKAFRRLDARLASDNAVGALSGAEGTNVLSFPGRERPKPLEYGAFRQRSTIQGMLMRIGGRDKTAHATIQDGDIHYSGIELSHDLARQLSHYLYGKPLRLHGSGRWNRTTEGEWELLQFTVESFEVLDDSPLSSTLSELRTSIKDSRNLTLSIGYTQLPDHSASDSDNEDDDS